MPATAQALHIINQLLAILNYVNTRSDGMPDEEHSQVFLQLLLTGGTSYSNEGRWLLLKRKLEQLKATVLHIEINGH